MPEKLIATDIPYPYNILFFITVIIVLLIEFSIAALCFLHAITFPMVVLLHMGAITLGTGVVYYLHQKRQNINIPLFWLIMNMVLGPFGTIISIVTLLGYHRHHRSSLLLDAHFTNLFSEREREESHIVYERIIFGLDNSVESIGIEPFQDIMAYGSLRQKQTALMKITRYFRPQFSPVLLYALKDKEAAIRVQAATIIAKLERDYMKNYLSLEKALQHHPEDVEKMILFAQLCNEYAHSGLLDNDSKKKTRDKAIMIYEKCIILKPNDNTLKLNLGRIYLQAEAFEKAANLLKECIDDEGLSSPNLTLWYIEALFSLKLFKKIRSLADAHILKFEKEENNIASKEVIHMFKSWNAGIPTEKMVVGN